MSKGTTLTMMYEAMLPAVFTILMFTVFSVNSAVLEVVVAVAISHSQLVT
jgi:hypothetical protein